MADNPIPVDAPLVAEADDWSDVDSGLGSSIVISMRSIAESIRKHREENGRTYHKFKEEKGYILPNDETEIDRLDLQHHLFGLTFNNRLHLCPAGKENKLHRALDAGTGTGIWAIDFADEHPECEVLGIDLSPMQPSFLPPNLVFQLDDLEEPWRFNFKFDFIYTRMMTGAFSDWPKYFNQAFENLNPGGYIELADCTYPFIADDPSLSKDSALTKWCQLMMDGCAAMGRPIDSAVRYKAQLEDAGFTDVVELKYKWPLNRWPKDKKAKELGMWTHENMYGGLLGFSLAIFTRILGWTREGTEVFIAEVQKEVRDHKIHSYAPIYVVYGKKPE
ncbi:S-adenosyl-L-methionine-dependent methyltransferase-17 [Coleophoma cylindrospora]|uniref:S-adenosyl-L-methionine-dependent methyltransferase-17 n=1 Tax=Coleophoma cylindrospora TaxID=1849047 RepID=A0A3D8SPY4_9HELO|nr:S-adenosyl-L-methionine-dependent methyltransferase-17 [Coleophoma cylindrospora]